MITGQSGGYPRGTLGHCWRASALLAGLVALSGCALTPTTYVDGAVVESSELYEGEPVAMHATEIPVTTAAEARARALEALQQRDVDLALYLYVQAVSLDATDAESFYAIGAIHDQRGNAELAGRAYLHVVELQPENAQARQALGLSMFDLRLFDTAERHLLAAVELDPGLWRAHNTLGMLADRKEQYDLAIEHYTAAIRADPSLVSVRNNRGYSKYLSGDLDSARRDFLAALEIDPTYDRAWRNLGLVFARLKDYERALGAMSNAIEHHVALNDVGYVAMLDGDFAVARRFFEDAIQESPRHYQTAQDNLAELNRLSKQAPALVSVEAGALRD